MIEFDNEVERRLASMVKIKVLGVGGAGCNTVDSMMEADLQDIGFVVANTDMQALQHSKAPIKIQLGVKTTKGLGSGANPDLGRRAAEEDLDKVLDAIGDADIVFIAAGMGGGTGSGAAPVIAKALKDRGILSIAVVTKPFVFEGRKRNDVAHEALEKLKREIDTLIVVPNQRLLDLVDRSVSMINAFAMVNEVLIHSVKSISDIITRSGHINVDFADLRSIMKGMGLAIMGTGSATGENRAREAAYKAISSPLLENMDIKNAKGILLNITGGASLSLHEINDAASVIYDESDNNAHIILGSVIDPQLNEEVIVSVIATGFDQQNAQFAKKDILQEASQKSAPEVVYHKQEEVVLSEQHKDILQRVEEKQEPSLLERVSAKAPEIPSYQPMQNVAQTHEDLLDIPAFLRAKDHAEQKPQDDSK